MLIVSLEVSQLRHFLLVLHFLTVNTMCAAGLLLQLLYIPILGEHTHTHELQAKISLPSLIASSHASFHSHGKRD